MIIRRINNNNILIKIRWGKGDGMNGSIIILLLFVVGNRYGLKKQKIKYIFKSYSIKFFIRRVKTEYKFF